MNFIKYMGKIARKSVDFCNAQVRKVGAGAAGTGLVLSGNAFAQQSEIVTAATDGLSAAQADGLTVGVALIGLTVGLIAIGIIWSLAKRGKSAA